MKRNVCGSSPISEWTNVSNKSRKKMHQKTTMGHIASRDLETRSDECSGQQSSVPLPVLEEILLNLPAHQVVQVCRLVCHEWKELVDSAAHWRKRCQREEIQPYDASRTPEDWRLFYFLSKYRQNLLKNPSADDGLRGWKVKCSGGDCWVIEKNRKPIPDTVTRCFVTSYRLCLKQQLIDLNKEGYSDAFMDQVQPHIKISDWYTTRWDCGCEYQICVELLDEKKNPIRTFQPEKVIFSFRNNEPWCQMTHVFKNYGPGVRFVRFTHGGKDTQFWAGHYGIRVTNSSVEICPPDESFRFTNRNLLKNPSAQEGFQGWEIVENGGDRWMTSENRRTFPVTECFVTCFGLCLKEQLIVLKKEGYSDALMDQQQPHIKISDWYAPFSDCGSQYQICVELLDEKKKPISTFQPEKVFFQQGKMYPWRQMTHVFMKYGPGVRFIRFTHGGKDLKFQKGQHGIQVTNSSVEICPTD
ncbi:hypothetical protein Q8A67_002671 [Cirrhinus molitorella]|uniref:Uncharacterized protein n=1 Tax=Cirrhinus molitorella TaxID=172907 RepID=A0AA88TW87_9TELE|nr:hypothetical protein Q8A67_002671 [Cirrhinus molitorella]